MNYKTELIQTENLNKYFFVIDAHSVIWDENERRDFYSKITEYFQAYKRQETVSKFLLGAVLAVPHAGRHLLIDGKKRMVNLIMLAAAAKNYLTGHYGYDDTDLVASLKSKINLLLYGFEKNSRLYRARITFSTDIENGYMSSIITGEKFEGEMNDAVLSMQGAYEYYCKAFESQSDQIAFIYYILIGIDVLLITSKSSNFPERILNFLSGDSFEQILKLTRAVIFEAGRGDLINYVHHILSEFWHEFLNGDIEGRPLELLPAFLKDKLGSVSSLIQ